MSEDRKRAINRSTDNKGNDMIKQLLVAASFCIATSANAEFISGNDLLSKLDSSDQMHKGFAFGYIAGVFDAGIRAVHCAPDNVVMKQVVDMVKKLLVDTPELRHQSGDKYVFAATKAAWPCAKKSNI